MRDQERHEETTIQIFIAVLLFTAIAGAGSVVLLIAEHFLGMAAAVAATLFYPVMGAPWWPQFGTCLVLSTTDANGIGEPVPLPVG